MGNRRTLSGSRNRLFSTAVGYEENTVTERVTVTVAPTIGNRITPLPLINRDYSP